MNFDSVILILSAFIFEINAEKYVASDFLVAKNCTEIQTIRTQKYVPYKDNDLVKGEHGNASHSRDEYVVGKLRTSIKYRYENIELNQTRAICCDGYQNYDEKHCIPVCTRSCGSDGICFSPDNCICNEGYSMDSITQKCKPDCSSECVNGFCTSPDVCSCHDGYTMEDDNHTCKPICQNGTVTCTNLESCVEPGVCRCIDGYARESLDRQLGSDVIGMCKPKCDQTCINGDCVSPNECQCHKNYTRVDEFTCERVYVASDFMIQKNCSETKVVKIKKDIPYEEQYVAQAGGYYDEYDRYYHEYSRRYRNPVYKTRTLYKTEYVMVNQTIAICCEGYQNYDEQNCLPVCSRSCGPHGICSQPDKCICNEGYNMDYLGTCKPVCQFECVNGHCVSPNYCACNEGYQKLLDDYICEPICSEGGTEDTTGQEI